ncbi:hypothetical protein EJA70_18130 [Pseudomonas sp. PB103]|nr:hypothetical protein EJA70_18130 [Pseudomonas sp. PB103]
MILIVPTLRVGMPPWTLCVRCWDAERPEMHSHAERGNDHMGRGIRCRRSVGVPPGCDRRSSL